MYDFKISQLKSFYNKYERFLIPGALILGFLMDLLTFKFINFTFALITLLGYLIISGFCIIFINLYEDGLVKSRFWHYFRIIAPLIIQYSFGSLFSAFVIFYSQSGSIFASWPFLFVIVFLMIANEVFSKYNTRPDIQFIVYFFAIFSFTNIGIPFVLKSLGPLVFISSAVFSAIIIFVILKPSSRFIPRIRKVKVRIFIGVLIVFLAMHIFYFSNIIPPIPLIAREMEVFYGVERMTNGDYRVLDRQVGFFEKIIPGKIFYDYGKGEAYVFSSIFAPSGMSIGIVHEWQFKDVDHKWQTKSRISFQVLGGRNNGYRGYSRTRQIRPGKWRVNIKTSSGQLIGRLSFTAKETNKISNLHSEER